MICDARETHSKVLLIEGRRKGRRCTNGHPSTSASARKCFALRRACCLFQSPGLRASLHWLPNGHLLTSARRMKPRIVWVCIAAGMQPECDRPPRSVQGPAPSWPGWGPAGQSIGPRSRRCPAHLRRSATLRQPAKLGTCSLYADRVSFTLPGKADSNLVEGGRART